MPRSSAALYLSTRGDSPARTSGNCLWRRGACPLSSRSSNRSGGQYVPSTPAHVVPDGPRQFRNSPERFGSRARRPFTAAALLAAVIAVPAMAIGPAFADSRAGDRGLVVSPTDITIEEGERGKISVALKTKPTGLVQFAFRGTRQTGLQWTGSACGSRRRPGTSRSPFGCGPVWMTTPRTRRRSSPSPTGRRL